MNNISCDVIQDLMPVYIEHMCSTESRKLVEAHMVECEGLSLIHIFRVKNLVEREAAYSKKELLHCCTL